MRTTRLASDVKCPNCGHQLDGATCVFEDVAPKPGDLSVCVRCKHWLRFNDDLTLRPMSQDDIDVLKPEEFKQLMRTTEALPIKRRR